MPYHIAGIDVHKKMLAVVVADVEVEGDYHGHGLEDLARDVGHGARGLRKNVGFTLVVVLTLAVGIGGNVAIFAVVDQLLPIRLSPGASAGRPECSRLSAPPTGQQLAEVTAVAEHQVADDDQAPAIPQRLESQIERAARAWGVHAHSKNQLRYEISRSSLQPIA